MGFNGNLYGVASIAVAESWERCT